MSRGRRGGNRPILRQSRVRLATRNGSCVLCPQPIVKGQRVGLIAFGWAHLSPCIVQRRQLANITEENR